MREARLAVNGGPSETRPSVLAIVASSSCRPAGRVGSLSSLHLTGETERNERGVVLTLPPSYHSWTRSLASRFRYRSQIILLSGSRHANQLTQQPSCGLIWEMSGDTGLRIQMETIALYASCGCQRGDRVSITGSGRSSTNCSMSALREFKLRGNPSTFPLHITTPVDNSLPSTQTYTDKYY